MTITKERVVVWFSCGVASTIAAHRAISKYKNTNPVEIVYCNLLADEHPDNLRFLRDVERWLQHPITIIASEKYQSVEQVWEKRKYMSGIKGAPCTVEMKKIPRFQFQLADDINIFGFAADEAKRIREFTERNPELYLDWILRDEGITKAGCFVIVRAAKIQIPALYLAGF